MCRPNSFFYSDACTSIEEQLLEKVEKNSTNVRLKTLRIIKSVCENGSPNFKRDLQRQTSGIRSCMQWKGPPHPSLGDAVNKMVRDAAQECINAVFDTESKAAGPKISAQGLPPFTCFTCDSLPLSCIQDLAPTLRGRTATSRLRAASRRPQAMLAPPRPPALESTLVSETQNSRARTALAPLTCLPCKKGRPRQCHLWLMVSPS